MGELLGQDLRSKLSNLGIYTDWSLLVWAAVALIGSLVVLFVFLSIRKRRTLCTVISIAIFIWLTDFAFGLIAPDHTLICLACGITDHSLYSKSYSSWRFFQVQRGMSRQQVDSLLGTPVLRGLQPPIHKVCERNGASWYAAPTDGASGWLKGVRFDTNGYSTGKIDDFYYY